MPSSPLHTFDRDLLRWLQSGDEWQRLPWGQRLQLRWRSHWASWNRQLSDAQLRQTRLLAAPLFIVGPWRSGTTVMHELLTAALGWPTPETWQCMNATAYRLLPAPPPSAAVARPMDGLEIHARSPQEDEFALLSLGVDSAYRAFLQPSRLMELTHTLEPGYWDQTSAQWLPRLEHFLAGVLASQQRPDERLILKSPNHSFRLPALLARFPAAQVVWMLRDAPSVLLSNRKMWRQMFGVHQLGNVPPGDLDAFLGLALTGCARMLTRLSSLGLQRLSFCWQEDLAERPEHCVAHVLAQLGLQVRHPEALEACLGRIASGRIERYDFTVPAAAASGVATLHAAQRAIPRYRSS